MQFISDLVAKAYVTTLRITMNTGACFEVQGPPTLGPDFIAFTALESKGRTMIIRWAAIAHIEIGEN
jgi:hypothetical protein